ncbi:PilW family protein [Vibrio rhodolitus]|uniref:PilW family protein n=1 Tax=Vibrio rhodolitus TaxID=2231649 RepID=UPI000E0A6D8F|nr:prepilin-type N-terminal cleavage/methylation domain-containing protein [Vibrio rhodolitus]
MRVRGFTLIEMIVTMLVGSILVLGIAGFVELGTKGYAQSVDRQRLQTQARFVLEKMTREASHAVPNVFIVDGGCLSFFPIVDSGFYAVSGADINFIVGNQSAAVSTLNDKQLLINPTQTLSPTDTLAALNNSFDLASVEDISATLSTVGKTFSIPDAASGLVGGSIVNRHYIADNERKVTYCISGNRITRQVGFTGSPMPLTDGDEVSVSGTLSYSPATVQHNGVVHIDLSFSQGGESTIFQQDVQVLNVP